MQQSNPGQPKQNNLSWSTPNQNQNQKPSTAPQKPAMPAQAVLPPTGPKSDTPKYVGMIVLGVIVGVLGAWAFASIRSGSTASNATSTEQSATSMAATDATSSMALGVNTNSLGAMTDDGLTISSPQKAGPTVAIDKAVVSAPTWVVVYEDNAGQPGRALGATLFFPGNPTGSVNLLRATVVGKSYLAAKQLDNGDRQFSLHTDQFVTENGKVQWVTFTTN